MDLTALQVQRVCHYAPMTRIFQLLLPLNEALVAANATTPLRAALFLSQWAHETCEFRYLEEIADGNAYDLRVNPRLAAKLGNTQPGDGPRFKGRGPIQITGRAGYAKASAALGVDFVAQPQLLSDPKWGFKAAAVFWRDHGCNAPADTGDVEGCTRIINGGLTGLDFRIAYYHRAVEALGVEKGVV